MAWWRKKKKTIKMQYHEKKLLSVELILPVRVDFAVIYQFDGLYFPFGNI